MDSLVPGQHAAMAARNYILIQQNSFVSGAAFIRRDPSAVMTMLLEWL